MADKKVFVEPEQIRTLAKTFQDWSTNMDTFLQKVNLLEIRPGSMPEGGLLVNRFKDRTGQLKTTLTNLQTMLYNTGAELFKIADVYATTHDLNKDDIDRLNDIINTISTTFPGVKDVIPQKVPTL